MYLDAVRGQIQTFVDWARQIHGERVVFQSSSNLTEDAPISREQLDELLVIAICTFTMLAKSSSAVQDEVARGSVQYTAEMSRDFSGLFRDWSEPSDRILAAIGWFEKSGQAITHAAEYVNLVRKVRLQVEDLDAIIEANRDVKEGRGVPLPEALDELQRHCST